MLCPSSNTCHATCSHYTTLQHLLNHVLFDLLFSRKKDLPKNKHIVIKPSLNENGNHYVSLLQSQGLCAATTTSQQKIVFIKGRSIPTGDRSCLIIRRRNF